jgi:hypothetical protein
MKPIGTWKLRGHPVTDGALAADMPGPLSNDLEIGSRRVIATSGFRSERFVAGSTTTGHVRAAATELGASVLGLARHDDLDLHAAHFTMILITHLRLSGRYFGHIFSLLKYHLQPVLQKRTAIRLHSTSQRIQNLSFERKVQVLCPICGEYRM